MHLDLIKNYNREGLFPGLNESEVDFVARVENLRAWSIALEQEDLRLQDLSYALKKEDRMSEAQLTESAEPIIDRFGVCPSWVPAYYCDEGLPFLTGGMAVQFIEAEHEPMKTFFQLKAVFKKQKKWMIYSGDELIRHEMCHVARAPLHSNRYEETFAYATSDSWLRRKIGGALNTPRDNQWVLLSLLLWMCASFLPIVYEPIHVWTAYLYLPFPILLTLGLWRNFNIHRELFHARELLKIHFPNTCDEILFRLTDAEIKQFKSMTAEQVPSWFKQLEGFRGEFLKSLYCH